MSLDSILSREGSSLCRLTDTADCCRNDLNFLNSIQMSPSGSACNLGAVLDNHPPNATQSCRFLLNTIRRIQPFLSTEANQVLVLSFVIMKLDYYNLLLVGLPLCSN